MLERFEQGYDVVLASVYAPGGQIIGVARLAAGGVARRSRTPSATSAGCAEIHTLSSLYRVYRAGTLRRAAETYGYLLVREPGFAANVELLLKLYNAGATVAEVPTVNDWTHAAGRLEDAAEADRARLRPPHGRPPRRPHPAAADLAAEPATTPERAREPTRRLTARLAMTRRRVGIVGGGVLGTVAGPAPGRRRGAEVTLLERGPSLGGLAGDLGLRRPRVDRFYHVIVPVRRAHDRAGRGARPRRPAALLAGRRRLLRRRRAAPASTASATSLRFPPLSPPGARAARLVRRPVPAAQRLRRARGRAARELAAPPLRRRGRRAHLAARCSTRASTADHAELPATYLWARTQPHVQRARRRAAAARRWATSSAATSA